MSISIGVVTPVLGCAVQHSGVVPTHGPFVSVRPIVNPASLVGLRLNVIRIGEHVDEDCVGTKNDSFWHPNDRTVPTTASGTNDTTA